ncbi:hypothetical protein JCM3774_004432 [Rhodotorula dairenensis]
MAYAHQVGGHADTILASPLSSSTLIKPASARELEFYQSLGPSLARGRFLERWTPAFYGTLRAHNSLHGRDGASDSSASPAIAQPPDMLVLENLTHRFQRPNVLDIKLGTQLHDEDAPDEKRERMQRAAAASTSGRTGVRLTGFQVWDTATQAYVQTDKTFGKSLEVEELHLGLARFFYPAESPLSRAEQAALFAAPTPPETPAPASELPTGTSSGEATPATSGSTSSNPTPPRAPSPLPPPPVPLPLDLLLPVLRTLIRQLEQLIQIWQTLEIRMRGGSLLVVVEGDPDALERAILRSAAATAPSSAAAAPRTSAQGLGSTPSSAHAAISTSSSSDHEDDDEDDAASVSTTDSDGNAKPETLLPFEMRLIDFAHTRSAEGEGPDEGVLLGLRTVQSLLEALTAKLEEQDRQGEERPPTLAAVEADPDTRK